MIRRLHDHLVSAHAVHAREDPQPAAVGASPDAHGGEFIGNPPHGPARGVRSRPGCPAGIDLRRGASLAPFAEWAPVQIIDLDRLVLEVSRARGTLSRDNDPPPRNRILLKFWPSGASHEVSGQTGFVEHHLSPTRSARS